jgi:hypothetical protein
MKSGHLWPKTQDRFQRVDLGNQAMESKFCGNEVVGRIQDYCASGWELAMLLLGDGTTADQSGGYALTDWNHDGGFPAVLGH